MIVMDRVSFAYRGSPEPVLEDVSLRLESGSRIAIMGANGSGKSTLALILKGILAPTSGTVEIDGISSSRSEHDNLDVMRRVGLVFQNPDNTIVSTTVERELAFGLENMGVSDAVMRDRVAETLVRFDLEQCRHASPDRLSGGERQRLALAAIMIMLPSHLVLDEPTSLLDPGGASRIRELIREASGQGTTVVHITQSAAEALDYDRVIVLAGGRIVRDCPPEQALADVEEFGIEGIGDISGDIPSPSMDGEDGVILSLDRVSCVYDRGTAAERHALNAVSLPVRRGSSTAVLGRAGAGKTSLLEILAGVEPPTRGRVTVMEGTRRAMAFQFPENQVFGDTVGEYVRFGPSNAGMNVTDTDRAVSEALERLGLDPGTYLRRDPFTLSGGEKRRVAIAGALAMLPDMLVLDEPAAGLDKRGTEKMTALFGAYVRGGGTLVFSTHDFRNARRIASRAVVMSEGSVETEGGIGDVFGRSAWIRSVEGH